MLTWLRYLLGNRLRAGDRVWLYGGYDQEPPWLQGGNGWPGTYLGFIEGPDRSAAVIQLDDSITVNDSIKRYAILERCYVGARWLKHGIVHVKLFEAAPRDEREWERGLWAESHASYRVTS